jgi:hypothetical protein
MWPEAVADRSRPEIVQRPEAGRACPEAPPNRGPGKNKGRAAHETDRAPHVLPVRMMMKRLGSDASTAVLKGENHAGPELTAGRRHVVRRRVEPIEIERPRQGRPADGDSEATRCGDAGRRQTPH